MRSQIRYGLAVGLVVVVTALAAACGATDSTSSGGGTTGSPEPGASGEQLKVAVIYEGAMNDDSWNEQGHAGATKAAETDGIDYVYSEKVGPDKYLEVMRNYARQGVDRVIAHGGGLNSAALEAAKDFPEVEFVVIDGTEANGSNVTCLQFDFWEMGYLAGALAAKITETGKIAIVMGQEIPVMSDDGRGFEAGAKSIKPDIEFKKVVLGDWHDVQKGREAGIALIGEGVDVLRPSGGGKSDAGVYGAAEDEGKFSIGSFADQRAVCPNSNMATVFADITGILYAACTEPLSHEVELLGVAAGLVEIGAYNEAVSSAIQSEMEEVSEQLRTGAVTRPY